MILKIVLFCLFLSISVDANCCDNGFTSVFCPHCYGKCVIREKPHIRLKEVLAERLFGQDHIIEPMSQMIEGWYSRNQIKGSKQSKGNLVSFHIAGDNGVGKTYAVTLMKESLFQFANSENFLYLSGTNFEGNDPDKVTQYKEIIFNSIVKQLEKCSKSLIVLDEVQYVHSSTLRVLQQFLDNSVDFVSKPNGGKIYKNEAIIGLISDFGREGRTKDMSFEDLETMVIQHTKELWDDPKLHQLITYTYPFVTLSDKDIENMIRYYVSTLIPSRDFRPNTFHSVHPSESAIRWMRYKIRKIPDENGRGVDKWLEKRFVPKLQESIEEYRFPVYVNVLYKDNDLQFVVHSIHDET